MSKFEYKVYKYDDRVMYNNDETIEGNLNKLGEQGWELVSAVSLTEGHGTGGDVDINTDVIKFFLKREK